MLNRMERDDTLERHQRSVVHILYRNPADQLATALGELDWNDGQDFVFVNGAIIPRDRITAIEGVSYTREWTYIPEVGVTSKGEAEGIARAVVHGMKWPSRAQKSNAELHNENE